MEETAKATKDLLLQKHNHKNQKPGIMNLCRVFHHSEKGDIDDKAHENRGRKFTFSTC